MSPIPVLELLLLMIIQDVGASPPPLPVLQCPVGTSLDSAFFFNITQYDAESEADRITAVRARYEVYKGLNRDELRDKLKDEMEITSSLTDEEIISRTSLYQSVIDLVTSVSGPHSNHHTNRFLLEKYIDEEFVTAGSEYTDDLRWFRWFGGYLGDQEVTMLACDADYHFPTGKGSKKTFKKIDIC